MAENEDYICVDCSRKAAGVTSDGGAVEMALEEVTEESVVVLATSMCTSGGGGSGGGGGVQVLPSAPVMASWSRISSASQVQLPTSHQQQQQEHDQGS